MRITICIATCKRLEQLKKLLRKIEEIELDEGIDITLAIVDNDPEKSSMNYLKIVSSNFRFKILFADEETRGIPFARNKAVSLVESDSDYVVFIDDDEFPHKNWINELIKVQKETNSDLVQGFVEPIFAVEPKSWMLKGNFFTYVRMKNQQTYPYSQVMTNNLLVSFKKLQMLKGPFNIDLGLMGSDDTRLGLDLNEIGCKMAFARFAIVYEDVPLSRINFKWLMQRTFRHANSYWSTSIDKSGSKFLQLLFSAFARILIGVIGFVPSLVLGFIVGLHFFYSCIRLILRGFGIILGLFGYQYEEYKNNYTF